MNIVYVTTFLSSLNSKKIGWFLSKWHMPLRATSVRDFPPARNYATFANENGKISDRKSVRLKEISWHGGMAKFKFKNVALFFLWLEHDSPNVSRFLISLTRSLNYPMFLPVSPPWPWYAVSHRMQMGSDLSHVPAKITNIKKSWNVFSGRKKIKKKQTKRTLVQK